MDVTSWMSGFTSITHLSFMIVVGIVFFVEFDGIPFLIMSFAGVFFTIVFVYTHFHEMKPRGFHSGPLVNSKKKRREKTVKEYARFMYLIKKLC